MDKVGYKKESIPTDTLLFILWNLIPIIGFADGTQPEG